MSTPTETNSNYWKANTASESKKLAATSPSWKGLAGTEESNSLDRQTRRARAKKKRLFFEDSEDESEPEEENSKNY